MTKFPPLIASVIALVVSISAQSSQQIDDRVRALYDAGQWAKAAKVAADAPVQSATSILYRGLALARLGQLVEASALFRKGTRLFPTDKRFPLESAGVAYRQQNWALAKRYLHRALRLDPKDTYGNDFLATLYLLDENLPAALKYWNRIGKPLIGSLQFAPAPPLDPVLRERAFDISAGQVFTSHRLQVTEANLTRLDVFTNTKFDLTPAEDRRVGLIIRSEPIAQPLAGWAGAVLPTLRGLPYETINLDFYNIHQRGLNFESLGRWDSNKRRLFFQFSGPFGMNPRIEYRYFLDARDEDWDLPGYDGGLNGVRVRKSEAGAAFAIGLSGKLQWTLGVNLAYREFRHGDGSSFFSSGWSAEIQNRFDYLLWSWPDRRLRFDTWGLLNTGRIFTAFPSRLITAEAGVRGTWYPQAKDDKYSVAALFHAGRTFGNAPLDELFMLGMERDNPYDFWLGGDVATTNGRKGSAPMGREFALSQLELSRRLFQIPFVRFDAGPFFDSGWAGDPSDQFATRGWRCAAGIEAKISTIGGVQVRFIYGRDLRDGRGAFYTAVGR